jgi:hypothetical protein
LIPIGWEEYYHGETNRSDNRDKPFEICYHLTCEEDCTVYSILICYKPRTKFLLPERLTRKSLLENTVSEIQHMQPKNNLPRKLDLNLAYSLLDTHSFRTDSERKRNLLHFMRTAKINPNEILSFVSQRLLVKTLDEGF